MKKKRVRWVWGIVVIGMAVLIAKFVVPRVLVRVSKDVVPIEEMLAAVTEKHLLEVKELIVRFDAEKSDLLADDFWLELKEWAWAALEEDGVNEKVLEAVRFRESGVPVDRFDNEMRLREEQGRIVLESAGKNGRWGDGDDLKVYILDN